MKDTIENRILNITGQGWIHSNKIAREIKGDKTAIIKMLHDLEETGLLHTKKVGRMKFYARNDTVESEEAFRRSVRLIKQNYDYWLDEFNTIPKLTTKKNNLTAEAKKILKDLEFRLDLSMVILTKILYQMNLALLPRNRGQERFEIIEDMMDEFMHEVIKKHPTNIKLIQEHFQNHTKNLAFKI